MKKKHGLAELIGNLNRRGGMYVQPVTYDTLVAYLLGYDHALASLDQPSELEPFSNWLDKKVGHECSLHWSGVIRSVFARGNDELAKERLFELFNEFLTTPEKKPDRKRQRAVSES